MLSRFLTEEWDVAVLAACGTVYKLSEAPCPLTCIEYPAQTDNGQIKSSREMDLVKVCPIDTRGCLCGIQPQILRQYARELTMVNNWTMRTYTYVYEHQITLCLLHTLPPGCFSVQRLPAICLAP